MLAVVVDPERRADYDGDRIEIVGFVERMYGLWAVVRENDGRVHLIQAELIRLEPRTSAVPA